MAGDRSGSRSGRQQSAEHAHRGGLPGTVRAEEAVDLALGDLEVEASHRIAVAEGSGQPAGQNRGRCLGRMVVERSCAPLLGRRC